MRNLLVHIFLYLVPGILALALGGTYMYLLINEKAVPEGLDTLLKIIFGYFFGAGAATAGAATAGAATVQQTNDSETRQ